jgi:hypothetical protein
MYCLCIILVPLSCPRIHHLEVVMVVWFSCLSCPCVQVPIPVPLPLSLLLWSLSPLSLPHIIVPPFPLPPIVLCVPMSLLPSSTVCRSLASPSVSTPLHPMSSCSQWQCWVLVHGGVLVAGPSLCHCNGGGGRGCCCCCCLGSHIFVS